MGRGLAAPALGHSGLAPNPKRRLGSSQHDGLDPPLYLLPDLNDEVVAAEISWLGLASGGRLRV